MNWKRSLSGLCDERKKNGMGTFDFDTMQKMQRQLREKYLEKWEPLSLQLGRELLVGGGLTCLTPLSC